MNIYQAKQPGNMSLRAVYRLLLAGVWVTLLVRLVAVVYFTPGRPVTYLNLATGLQNIPDNIEWMNIYLNQKKIGYSYDLYQWDLRGGYTITNLIALNTVLAGIPTRITTRAGAWVDSLFRLRDFDFEVLSGAYHTRVTGRIQNANLQVTIHEAGDSSRWEVPAPPQLTTAIAVKALLANQGIQPGQRLRIPVFEPLTRESFNLEVEHLGKHTLPVNGVATPLNKICLRMQGLPTYMYLDDNGISFREEGLMGLVLERTTAAAALEVPCDLDIDLVQFYAVPVEGMVRAPREAERLTVEILGLEETRLPDLLQQYRLRGVEGGVRLGIDNRPRPVQTADLAPYLESNPLVQSKNPRVTYLSQKMINKHWSRDLQVGALVNWVYQYLEKVPVANLTSTLEILDKKQGDCSEHTILFTALSRSLNIPTRINVGIVYLEDRFLYHAWPSVVIDDHWVSVDPTLGQERADATHIPFLEGDLTGLSELVPLLGQIRICIPPNSNGSQHDQN